MSNRVMYWKSRVKSFDETCIEEMERYVEVSISCQDRVMGHIVLIDWNFLFDWQHRFLPNLVKDSKGKPYSQTVNINQNTVLDTIST